MLNLSHWPGFLLYSGFFNRVYYCHACKKAYEDQEGHWCPNECMCC